MNTGSALVAHGQAAKPMQPGQRTLDHPPGPAQAAPVRCPTLGELRRNPSAPELVAVGLRIVPAVALYQLRLPRGSAGAPAQRRHHIDEREQLGDAHKAYRFAAWGPAA